MPQHTNCSTCLHNIEASCGNEASRYFKSPLKSWNTCSAHQAPRPTPAELMSRLATCAAALKHLSDKSGGE